MLSLLARGYAQAMRIREAAYIRGGISSWRPPAPCISVGNISWGGSGKTPLCSWIMRWCLDRGLRPALLTRGYGARPGYLPYVVNTNSPVNAAGDEPLMLARENAKAQVLVDPRRSRAGRLAWRAWKPDVYILDDGFQHLAVQRDIDIVLLRSRDMAQDWNRVIPSGPWREGAAALQRASAIVINAPPDTAEENTRLVQTRLSGRSLPVFHCSYWVTGLRRVQDDRPVQPVANSLLVSAVGSPEGVEASAAQILPGPPLAHLRFADHHAYTASDWTKIVGQAESLGAQCIVCTPKDKVKLEPFADARLCVMDVDLWWPAPLRGEHIFAHWLEQEVDRFCKQPIRKRDKK